MGGFDVTECVKRVLRAQIYDLVQETSLQHCPRLSRECGNDIFIKREDQQAVFSFKLRGAYAKMRLLSALERECGVICASAGNHAQGVAMSATHLGLRAVIVMPQTTPDIKVRSVRERGGEVVLHGDTFDQACVHAYELAARDGMTFIHPYDDEEVIAGQGTIGREILQQMVQPPDVVFLPVGGGGLIAGVAAFIKYVSPGTRIVGVESDESASLKAALAASARVRLPEVGIFCDGVAVAQVGAITYEYCRALVDEVVAVTTDEVCAAIKDIFEETRVVAEPAGAVSLAGLKKYARQNALQGQRLVCILSGANISFARLRHISERTELGAEKEAIFAVTIPERPGAFRAFCEATDGYNLTEFNYRYTGPAGANIFLGVELKHGASDRQRIADILGGHGMPVLDLSENEVAKMHLRYMIGGPGSGIAEEAIYRVQFPEKPGALLKFLRLLGDRWNITLFHYRNHAASQGRVLLGVEIGKGASAEEFEQQLNTIAYVWHRECANDAYQLFLR